jgi:hypothetical protein
MLRHLERREEGPGRRAVLVLTNRAEIVSQPTWCLVRDGAHLTSALGTLGSPTVVAIDIDGELPIWLGPLVARLRGGGLGLIRLAVPGEPEERQLASMMTAVDPPLTIELLTPVEPERVLQLIEAGYPIGSISGAPVSAELLVAMRREAERG